MTAIFLLPYLSDTLPHEELVIAHATAEIEKINDVSTTDKPKSLANGGTKTVSYTHLTLPTIYSV